MGKCCTRITPQKDGKRVCLRTCDACSKIKAKKIEKDLEKSK